MTLAEVIDTLQTWIRNADDEYDREEMGRVAGLKEALHEIKRIEPCDDCISREQALKEFEEDQYHREYCIEHEIDRSISMEMVRIRLHDLPSVTPQPKTGHWIETGAEELPFGITVLELTCSTCGWSSALIIPRNYCPKCGTKMEEGEKNDN